MIHSQTINYCSYFKSKMFTDNDHDIQGITINHTIRQDDNYERISNNHKTTKIMKTMKEL